MLKKNIIIAGYPKSGTTWASRLIAELASCPLQGDWGYDHIHTLYEEGKSRKSPYDCYKTHYNFDAIPTKSDRPVYKIIHIIRDPRDIVISGSNYFVFSNFMDKILRKLGFSLNQASRGSLSFHKKKEKMIQAVLYGDYKINKWLSSTWEDYVSTFKNKKVLAINYENLLVNPRVECVKIAAYLNLDVDDKHIDYCIKKQSFQNRKKEIPSKDNTTFNNLLNQGKMGYWKTQFSDLEKQLFTKQLSSSLIEMGYEISLDQE